MSFSIDIQPIADFKRIRISSIAENTYIDIITKGGLINSWTSNYKDESIDIIEGNNFENGWEQFEAHGFRSGKMNPFSCRLHKGIYIHEATQYKLDKYYLGEHAIHGIVYDAVFEIVSTHQDENEAYVILQYHYHQLDKGYPFEYSIQLKWILEKQNKVSVQTLISNHDKNTIPMMDGWHPYFTLGPTIDACKITFTNKGILEYDSALIPTGKLLENHQFENGLSLDGIELDNGYLLAPENSTCMLENNHYQLIVSPDTNYPYLQLYTPPHRKSIAIENLSAAPNCFNNRMGLHIMQPHSNWKLETSFQLFKK